jgi:hypothetical protein
MSHASCSAELFSVTVSAGHRLRSMVPSVLLVFCYFRKSGLAHTGVCQFAGRSVQARWM